MPLQTLCQAIFDAILVHIVTHIPPPYLPHISPISRPHLQAIFDTILVHIVNLVSPSGKWQQLQQQMCAYLPGISPVSPWYLPHLLPYVS